MEADPHPFFGADLRVATVLLSALPQVAIWIILVASVVVGLTALYLLRLAVTTTRTIASGRQEHRRLRRELMREASMCPDCGYTVRVATDRCRECGSLAYSTDAGSGD